MRVVDKCQMFTFYFLVNIEFIVIHHGDVVQTLATGGAHRGQVDNPAPAGRVVEAVTGVQALVSHQHHPPAQTPTLRMLTRSLHFLSGDLTSSPRLEL